MSVDIKGEIGAILAGRPGQGRRDDPVDDMEGRIIGQPTAVVDDPAIGTVAPLVAGRAAGTGNNDAVIDEVGLVGPLEQMAGVEGLEVAFQAGEIADPWEFVGDPVFGAAGLEISTTIKPADSAAMKA